ncbi:MAG: hypothetical protein V4479_04460 [Actinomycetota bacterium]
MSRLVRWFAALLVITAVFATIYVVMQQVERQGADDAPARLASQVASQLVAGVTPRPAAEDRVDLATSTALFYVVYDVNGRAADGTGYLGGTLATVPPGVVAAGRTSAGDHVTWQTSDGLRFAVVVRRSGASVVLAGQSLAPTETRIDGLGLLVLAAWLAAAALLVIAFFVDRALRAIE